MSQTSLDTSANNNHAMLLTASFGGLSYTYCNRDQPISIGEEVFQSAPSLEITFGKFQGGVEPDEAEIQIRVDDEHPPFDGLSTGYAHADVRVKIEECDASIPSTTRRELFFGGIEGKATVTGKLIRCRAYGIKARLAMMLGVPALTTCPWTLFHENTCRVPREGRWLRVVLSETNVGGVPYRVRVVRESDGTAPTLPNVYFAEGYLDDEEGLTIRIRKSLGDNRLDLGRFPPPGWSGKTLTLWQGCNGFLSTCRAYDNEINFGGIGYGIPARHPVLESGG